MIKDLFQTLEVQMMSKYCGYSLFVKASLVVLMAFAVSTKSALALAQTMTVFSNGEIADAQAVNDNFNHLDARISQLEPIRYDISCETDTGGLQAHWDDISQTTSQPVIYFISGTCLFDYQAYNRQLHIMGSGRAQTKVVGSFYPSGEDSFLMLSNLTIERSGNEIFPGEVIRPSSGASLVLSSVELLAGVHVSAWELHTQLWIRGTEIADRLSLYGADLFASNSEIENLWATSARVMFHGGGVNGTTQLENSSALFTTMGDGVPLNWDSYLTGAVTLTASKVKFINTSMGPTFADFNSSMILEGTATAESIRLRGSSIKIFNPESSVISGAINMEASRAFVDTDTTLSYQCDERSYVLGDQANESANLCR